jgi:hypothetical protein
MFTALEVWLSKYCQKWTDVRIGRKLLQQHVIGEKPVAEAIYTKLCFLLDTISIWLYLVTVHYIWLVNIYHADRRMNSYSLYVKLIFFLSYKINNELKKNIIGSKCKENIMFLQPQ